MSEAARPVVTTRPDDSGLAARIEGSAIGDTVYRAATTVFAVCIPLLLVFIAFEIVAAAWPALRSFGLGFLASGDWDPPDGGGDFESGEIRGRREPREEPAEVIAIASPTARP